MQVQTVKVDTQKSLFDDKIQEIVGFLNTHYDIRIPIQDPSKIQISCKDKDRYEFQPDFDDISLHLMSEGLSVGDSILRKIIRSPNYLKPCNPIQEYFDSIRGQWHGESEIDKFCKYITPRTFDDNTEEFYSQRMNKLVKKWMVACVACWLQNKHNDVALGFISSREGLGKTHLAQFFIPDIISEYFVKSASDERKFNMEDAFVRYMIINFDELVGINKGNFEVFKKCLSDDSILIKWRHKEFSTLKARIGCAMFTSNYNQEMGGFIPEYWGPQNRRIGSVEIMEINREYSTVINKNQMWSEALNLLEETTFNYKFDQDDYDDFAIYNSRYIMESDAMKYVQLYMAVPETDDEGEKMNATQILQRLIHDRRIKSEDLKKVTAQKIGAALKLLGYQKVSYRPAGYNNAHNGTPLWGYHVKFLE